MRKRVVVWVGVVVGLAVLAIGGLWLASPLFINRVIDEGFPDAEELAANPDQLMAMTEEERAQVQDEVLDAAADMPDTEAHDDMPEMSGGPITLAQGTFTDTDAFHRGSGTATVYELDDGSHILRFDSFSVTNGPDLHVFLLQGDPFVILDDS